MDENIENNRGLLPVLIIFAIILIARMIWLYLADPARYPLKTVSITAPYQYVSRKSIEEVLSRYDHKSWFTLQTSALKKELLGHPWANDASVEKIWPDILKINVSEKRPAAYWHDGIVTQKGEIIATPDHIEAPILPVLSGMENQHLKVLQVYQKLSKLLEKHNLYVAKLHQNADETFELTLTNNIKLYLGKEDVILRMERFCKAWSVVAKKGEAYSVDLRYTHGMAIRWNQ